MKLDKLLNDIMEQTGQTQQTISTPKVQNGHGVEIEQDQRTAKRVYHYYIIRNGVRKTIGPKEGVSSDQKGPQQFWQNITDKHAKLFDTAFRAISEGAERKRFKEFNTNKIDVVGMYTGEGENRSYKIIATGDKGQLQMEFDSRQMKWIKR